MTALPGRFIPQQPQMMIPSSPYSFNNMQPQQMTDPNFAAVQLWQRKMMATLPQEIEPQGQLTTATLTVQDAEMTTQTGTNRSSPPSTQQTPNIKLSSELHNQVTTSSPFIEKSSSPGGSFVVNNTRTPSTLLTSSVLISQSQINTAATTESSSHDFIQPTSSVRPIATPTTTIHPSHIDHITTTFGHKNPLITT